MCECRQAVSPIYRQTAIVIDCQSVGTGGSFLLFSLTGSCTSDRGRQHAGSHLHLNKDRQWLCQSPLSKLPYLINASTVSFFPHPFVEISLKQKWLLFAFLNRKKHAVRREKRFH